MSMYTKSDIIKREYPDVPLISVGAVVIDNDEILLIKRGYPPSAGFWSIPGGLVNAGERLEEAVLRELYEETNIRGTAPRLIGLTEILVWSGNVIKYHYVIVDFLVKPLSRDVIAGGDAIDAKFFKVNEALRKLKLTLSTKKLIEYITSIDELSKITPILITINQIE